MHVDREKMSAKFWLDPDVSLAENYDFNRKELRVGWGERLVTG
jgi:hypothetical protein